MRSSIYRIAALALAVLAIAACAEPPTAEPTALPAAIAKGASPPPAPTRTAAPSLSPTPTHTATPAPSPTPTRTSTPSPSPTPTATPTPSPTPTEAPTPSPTPEAPTPSPTPTEAVPSAALARLASFGALTQLALGESRVCGLREDGRAVCVGSVSEEVDGSAAFSAVSSGKDYFCGLRDDGAVSCWGNSRYCQTCAPEGVFSALSAGNRHACALSARGEAVCWGDDRHGRATPPPAARFSSVSAGGGHGCGIAEFGNLVCWGRNGFGQSESREGPFSALALGSFHTCALLTDGAAFCQGSDSHGQASPPPTAFAQIAAGDSQTCGLAPEGGLECWGILPISDHSEKFASVSVGYGRTCALTAAGAPKCWPAANPAKDPTNGAWLSNPVEMFPLPAGGAAVVNQSGYIETYPPDGGEPRTALDLTERTRCCRGETGMLSAAPDPDFVQFPFIYVYWQADGGDVDADIFEGRVSRFPMTDEGEIDADGELVILRLPQRGDRRFGGAIRFGPDGMLHLGLGDRAEAGAGAASAADLSSLAGKIIRIDVRGATEETPYRAPPDNPFVGAPDARPEIWALGLRNPWRMSFAPNGDLIVADVGDVLREEVSIAERGANLGWPLFEANRCAAQDASLCDGVEGYAFPIYEYPREGGNCAIIGGMFAPDGKYIFGDYCSGRVWSLERTAPDVWRASEIMELPGVFLAFGSDAEGSVYALNRLGYVTKVSEQGALTLD